MEEENTRQFFTFSLCELSYGPLESNSCKKIANILQIKRFGIRAMKFEKARIHFLGEVFVAVAVVVA